mmetsp:Transcript_21629/g.30537  ORF Transcript_21629/g.30537 Transcript_21629/m.30537 type:complete len:501 (+) Transcript_21629:95-1597(+)
MELPSAVTDVVDSTLEYIYSLEEYVAPTVVLVPSFVKGYVEQLSEAIGFDVETLSYTLGLFLCYPLGVIMTNLPYGKIRHLFSFLLGAFLLQFTLGVQWIHQLITSLVVYAMCLVLPPKMVKTAVPIFVMIYMCAAHLHRQYTNYLGYDLDFSGTQMVITQKLYMFAYNVYDGHELKNGRGDRASQKCSKFALKELPGLIEFLGYTFCFANVLAGPAAEFTAYSTACDGTLLYDANGKPKGKIPSAVWPTLQNLLQSIVHMGLFVFLGGMYPILDPTDPQKNTPAVLSEAVLSQPWVNRYFYLWMSLVAVRQKYYFAWKNAEGALNIWYAGFEGFDEDGKAIGWGNSVNVNIFSFETASNIQTLSKEWNKRTSLWLTRYVYIRTGGSLMAVYGLSAFWHGFYPGYYLFFLSIPLLTMCERMGRKKISPYFSDKAWGPYDIFCKLVTSLFVEYTVAAFPLLAFHWTINLWKNHYFFGHICAIVFYIAMMFTPSPKKKDKKE